MAAASQKALEELHTALANELTDRIVNGDETVIERSDEGETRTERTRTKTSPAVLAVAAKFLKDNSTFVDPAQDSATAGLEAALAKRGRRPNKADLRDAMGNIGKELLQ